jgi:hypothetical protein
MGWGIKLMTLIAAFLRNTAWTAFGYYLCVTDSPRSTEQYLLLFLFAAGGGLLGGWEQTLARRA